MEDSLALLTTEQRNLRSKHMDQMSTGEILTVMNKEDQRVAEAVQTVLPQVEEAIKYITTALKKKEDDCFTLGQEQVGDLESWMRQNVPYVYGPAG